MDRRWFLSVLGMSSLAPLASFVPVVEPEKGLIKPKNLQKGQTIGLISPASRLHDPSKYDKIVKKIKKMGFRVKEGKYARDQYGYFSGTDEQRAHDLNAMFADDSVDAILPFRGGWGCNRILNLIDYELIQNNPKILVGFSDITSLLLAIYAKTGLVTFHGPVGKSEWTKYTKRHFRKALSYQQPYTIETYDQDECESCNNFSVITPGKATGRLLGGNLTVLTAMIGSDYLPDWKGNILFVEDVGEDIYRIDRMLTQLKLSGALDQVSGFIFGQCTACKRSNSYSLTLGQVLDHFIKPLGIPAFSGAFIGHIDKMVTLPVGLPVKIDAQKGNIILNEAATV
ncbi:MAG TPA: LD-carboxypeptidase [Balneolaceae bacterium]|nr:LD-carboxypeptidase [Balneolaceae bacterium]